MPASRAAATPVISPACQRATNRGKFSGRGAGGLPGAYVLPLALGHKGQDLQHQIGNEGAHQILPPAGVQQGHVQHAHVGGFLLGQHPPLLQDFPVVAAQAVDAGHIEQVPRPQPAHHALILGPLKILAGLLVHEQVPRRDKPQQGAPLAVFVLVGAGHPHVAVNFSLHNISLQN